MIDLLISPETLRKSVGPTSTQVFSEIYFQLDTDIFFPTKGWDDFTVIILNDWIKNTISCFYSGWTICYFMDGSFKFSIDSKDALFFIEFFDNNKVIDSASIDKSLFLNILKRATNLVIRNLRQKSIITKETKELQESFYDLQKLLKCRQ